MKPTDKRRLLEELSVITENHLQQAIRVFQNLPEKQLLAPAIDGGWSPAQCLEHLIRYGFYYLPEIKKALLRAANTPDKKQFRSSWLGDYFTKMMRPETGTKKIKAFRAYIPPRDLNAHKVVAEFIQQLELLLLYLREASRFDIGAVRVPVSIAKFIRLKLGDVFQFVIAHNERHMLQIMRSVKVQEHAYA